MNPMAFQFNQFMQQMRGQDPNKLINQILSSGRINQSQINQAYQQVESMKGQLEGMKKNFGF